MTKTNIATFPPIHRELLLRQDIEQCLMSSDTDLKQALCVLMRLQIDILKSLNTNDMNDCTKMLSELIREYL